MFSLFAWLETGKSIWRATASAWSGEGVHMPILQMCLCPMPEMYGGEGRNVHICVQQNANGNIFIFHILIIQFKKKKILHTISINNKWSERALPTARHLFAPFFAHRVPCTIAGGCGKSGSNLKSLRYSVRPLICFCRLFFRPAPTIIIFGRCD